MGGKCCISFTLPNKCEKSKTAHGKLCTTFQEKALSQPCAEGTASLYFNNDYIRKINTLEKQINNNIDLFRKWLGVLFTGAHKVKTIQQNRKTNSVKSSRAREEGLN